MDGPPVIEVVQLAKRYGAVTAVDGVSFRVGRGEVFGLLGPNGAGKTTTLEILVGLRQADSGRARLLEFELPCGATELKRRIGVQLQHTALPRHLQPREVLELFAAFYPRHRPLEELLARFGLGEGREARRPVRSLSLGQQRRLAVATALVHDPEVLFLDEPTAGLDPQAKRAMWEVLAERRERGQTTFLTTHDMHEAEQVCDRVAILDHGRVLALGAPRPLAHQAASEHAVWVQARQGAEAAVLERLAGVRRAVRHQDGVTLYSTEVLRTLTELLRLSEDGWGFDSIEVRPPSLEDLYLQLTGRRIRE